MSALRKNKEPPNFRCSCGRIAEWIGELSGEPECFEVIHKDKPYIWKQLYRDKERHEE